MFANLIKPEQINKRKTSLDIIRILAVFFVVSIHFFLHNGYYGENHNNINMYIMCTMRTVFTTCIPLFLLLSGYLVSKKTLSKKYYLGIIRILLIYFMSSIACLLFRKYILFRTIDFKTVFFEIFNFSLAPYSWYIEMYIGLFLIIPFLNIMYNNIQSKRHKKLLLFTLFAMTTLPTLLNIFTFTTNQAWYNPETNSDITKILPNWWTLIYPFTYYFFGAYIREYGLKIKTPVAIVALILSIALFGTFNSFRSYNTTFEDGYYIQWYGIEPFIMALLIFTLLLRLKTDKLPIAVRWILWKLSDATLGIYLLSYIFDKIIYDSLVLSVPVMTDRLKYYFIVVPLVFIGSLILSLIFNIILKVFDSIVKEFKPLIALLTDKGGTMNESD